MATETSQVNMRTIRHNPRSRIIFISAALSVQASSVVAVHAADGPLVFERSRIGDVTFESCSVFDVNNDGKPDVVSGGYWFEGPAFTAGHRICDYRREEDYYDAFSDYPMDVNGDGFLDVVTGGWWGATLRWVENPKGQDRPWAVHDIDRCGNVETTRFWDVDGDGRVEACPNAGGNIVAYRLDVDAGGKGQGTFTRHVLKKGGNGHGLGFGDLNGDGRGDFIGSDGWLEAPKDPWNEPWTWHPEFKLGAASVPILVHDVNGDGRADFIVGMGHDYGLFWYEQGADPAGKRTWTRREIETDRSQYHDMTLADLDNDGKPELVTGKRFRAHQWADPGSRDPLGVYYYK
ncbi:MAG: VCBS repeat-containing protein, partial [Phycisphaerae bacterium]